MSDGGMNSLLGAPPKVLFAAPHSSQEWRDRIDALDRMERNRCPRCSRVVTFEPMRKPGVFRLVDPDGFPHECVGAS